MNYTHLTLAIGFAFISNTANAEPQRFVCENWHPRLGQMNDLTFLIDVQQQVCNGQKCKMTDTEFAWSEQGDRYEHVINRLSGEGHIFFAASQERTAVLKNCRPSPVAK